jgi:hypothetical protein
MISSQAEGLTYFLNFFFLYALNDALERPFNLFHSTIIRLNHPLAPLADLFAHVCLSVNLLLLPLHPLFKLEYLLILIKLIQLILEDAAVCALPLPTAQLLVLEESLLELSLQELGVRFEVLRFQVEIRDQGRACQIGCRKLVDSKS